MTYPETQCSGPSSQSMVSSSSCGSWLPSEWYVLVITPTFQYLSSHLLETKPRLLFIQMDGGQLHRQLAEYVLGTNVCMVWTHHTTKSPPAFNYMPDGLLLHRASPTKMSHISSLTASLFSSWLDPCSLSLAAVDSSFSTWEASLYHLIITFTTFILPIPQVAFSPI